MRSFAPARRVLTLLAAGLLGTLLFAAPADAAESLKDALVSAYTTNPTLKAQRAQLRATDESVAKAVSGWRPTVTATGSHGESQSTSFNPLSPLPIFSGTRNVNPQLGQLQFTQPLFRSGRNLFNHRQAKANVEVGRANLVDTEQRVLLDTVTAYFDVVRDRAILEIRRNNVSVLEQHLKAERDRFEVGDSTRTDVAQAEARLAGARSELTASEGQLARSVAAYERVVGHVPGALEPVAELPKLPMSPEEARELALGQNPSLLAARNTERASSAAIKSSVGALGPSIDLVGTVRKTQNQTFPGDRGNTRSLLFQGTMPLYQAGTEWANIREAKANNSRDRLRIAESERETIESVVSAWASLDSARAQITSNESQVKANEIAYEGVQLEREVGARTTLDVLDAEQELLGSRVALVGSRHDEMVAAYSVLSAAGGLTAAALGLPVELYDPRKNFGIVHFLPFGPWGHDED